MIEKEALRMMDETRLAYWCGRRSAITLMISRRRWPLFWSDGQRFGFGALRSDWHRGVMPEHKERFHLWTDPC